MNLPGFTEQILNHLYDLKIPSEADAAIILGSGLGGFSDYIDDAHTIPYREINGMPETSVTGHEGTLITGRIDDYNILAFSGRFHYYEGFSFRQTAIPVYIAHEFQAGKLIVSNAAGAINRSFTVGDLMVIESILRNVPGVDPRGYQCYRYNQHQWVDKVRKLAAELGIVTQTGNYIYVTGPNYETRAEIRAFRRIGADAVGMSTATEMFEAARLNLKSAAISLITNMSTGITAGKLRHEDVEKTADFHRDRFAKLVKKLIADF